MTKKQDCTKHLKSIEACDDAVTWAKGRTLKQAWTACENPQWMLWYLGKTINNHDAESLKKLVLIACECARFSLVNWKDVADTRPIKAIETAEDFETSLYRLVNVERILSETGTEITFNELNESIK